MVLCTGTPAVVLCTRTPAVVLCTRTPGVFCVLGLQLCSVYWDSSCVLCTGTPAVALCTGTPAVFLYTLYACTYFTISCSNCIYIHAYSIDACVSSKVSVVQTALVHPLVCKYVLMYPLPHLLCLWFYVVLCFHTSPV